MEEVFQTYRQLHIKEKGFNLPSSRAVSYMPPAAEASSRNTMECYQTKHATSLINYTKNVTGQLFLKPPMYFPVKKTFLIMFSHQI